MPEPRRSTRLQKRGQYDVRDWLDVGYAFFIQQKPQANVQNKWEDEVHLVYSQVGASDGARLVRDTLTGDRMAQSGILFKWRRGETTELKLIYNVNFTVSHIPDVEHDELPDEEKAPKPGYHDLFYLTADHGALGKLEGPAVWSLGCFVDWEAHELLVSATGQRDGKRPRYALLRLPLKVERAAEFFRLSIDTKEMDKEAPGLHKEQTDLVAYTTAPNTTSIQHCSYSDNTSSQPT
ncbi:hypothetical protein N0V88_001862 [Collariella sp. IMI 366227]|nr:hypothetical protein N0V88_001862 [Collariella sp. IMI 366227]